MESVFENISDENEFILVNMLFRGKKKKRKTYGFWRNAHQWTLYA